VISKGVSGRVEKQKWGGSAGERSKTREEAELVKNVPGRDHPKPAAI